jgi:DtxR family Mn-dependent transcriptional regulator
VQGDRIVDSAAGLIDFGLLRVYYLCMANEESLHGQKHSLSEGLVTPRAVTAAHEDYLKAIYLLQSQGVRVHNSALAHHLGVSPASTTNMVKRLAELEMVLYEPYQEIGLTDAGRRVALEVLRHHRLLELYLHKQLHMPWDQVHADAERLEHVISETLEDAIADALGNPTIDPHGDPIPTKDGHVGAVMGAPLTLAEVDVPCRLVRVLLQDAERLTYLGSLGLVPGASLTLLKRAPFAGPLVVDVAGEVHAIAHEMAAVLIVAPEPQ